MAFLGYGLVKVKYHSVLQNIVITTIFKITPNYFYFIRYFGGQPVANCIKKFYGCNY